MRPLPGALVQLASLPVTAAPRSIVADSGGAFVFDSIALGSYVLGFTHPGIDSLGIEPHSVRLDLRQPRDVDVTLATPSAATLVRSACKTDIAKDGSGILHGYARSARDMMPVPDAIVVLEWTVLNTDIRKVGFEPKRIAVRANAAGAFRICGIPLDESIQGKAFLGPDSTGAVHFTVDSTGVQRRDFLIGYSIPVAATVVVPDSTPVSPFVIREDSAPVVRRVTRGVSGVVRDANGLAIYRARVIIGADSALTSDDGSFVLENVPTGSQTLEAKALGYLPVTTVVDIGGEDSAAVSLQLVEAPVELSTGIAKLTEQRVTGKSLTTSLAYLRKGFEARSKTGAGMYLTHEQIMEKNPSLPSELFRTMNGLTVSPGSGGNNVFVTAAGNLRSRSSVCQPLIFLDGARTEGAQIDALVVPADLRAIEVYPRGELAPAQFRTLNGCGAIVVWTKSMWGSAPAGSNR
jgi:hypothetical protein